MYQDFRDLSVHPLPTKPIFYREIGTPMLSINFEIVYQIIALYNSMVY